MKHVALFALAVVLSGCGPGEEPTAGGRPASHWVEALRDRDAKVRKKATLKLGNLGAADPVVVQALIGALKDGDAEVRAEAALALRKIGPAAGEAVPALTEARSDKDAAVRGYAARALEKIQDGGGR